MSAETQARPDLCALDRETRINIAVAETQGAVWESFAKPDGSVAYDLVEPGFWLGRAVAGRFTPEELPRVTRDPAAAWALAVKERIALIPSEDGWYALAPEDVQHGCVRGTSVPTLTVHGPEFGGLEPQEEPGWAVALAVLAKHGVEVPS